LKYTGPDRRTGDTERRKEDCYNGVCSEHAARIELANERHGAAAKRDEHICEKVKAVKTETIQRFEHMEATLERLRNVIVGRWTFWVVIGMLITGIGGMGFQQHWAFREILTTLNQVEQRSIRSEEKVEALTNAVEVLGKRQDTLRDQNLKLLDKVGGLHGGG
jgi:hypothetical protein